MVTRAKKFWWGRIASLTVMSVCELLSISIFADGKITINGVEWTYTDKNDETKTVTLGASGTMSTSKWTPTIDRNTKIDAADIPWTMEIDGGAYTVTSVGKYAFGGCNGMSGTLAIPDTVKTIAERAFWACRGLTGISTIGGVEKLGKYSFYLDTDKTLGRFPDLSNVTEISDGAFYGCKGLAGEVLLGSGLQTVPKQGFQNSSLDMVTIPRNITKINERAFAGTKLTAFVAPGPIDASSGEQSFLTIDCRNQFKGCSDLKTVVIGKNTKGTNRSDGSGGILNEVNGCSLFLPNNADWENCDLGGTDNKVVYYGSGAELDIEIDDLAKTITAIPTTAYTFTNVLNVASALKTGSGYTTKVRMTNAIEVAEGTITDALIQGVVFESLVFAVKTQAQLDMVMNATGNVTVPLCIDPTGAKAEMTVPADRKVWVLLPGTGSYCPKINGLKISFR